MDCSVCQKKILTYLTGPDSASDITGHLNSCPSCRETLEEVKTQLQSFQKEAQSVPPPSIKVKELMQNEELQKPEKKPFYLWKKIAAAAVLLPAGFTAALFASDSFYYWVGDRTPLSYDPLERLVSDGYALQVNAEETTEEIRFEITEVVADESQLHVYYESEHVTEENHYVPVSHIEGFNITNKEDIWDVSPENDHERFIHIENHTILEETEEGVTRGRFAFPAPDVENGVLQLHIDTFVSYELFSQEEPLPADISLEVPFERKESTRYDLHDTELLLHDDISYIFEQMKVGPAATTLVYRLSSETWENDLSYHHPAAVQSGGFTGEMISQYRNEYMVTYESLFYGEMSAIEFQFDDFLVTDLNFYETELDFNDRDTVTVDTALGEAIIEQTAETQLTAFSPDKENLDTGSLHLDITKREESLDRATDHQESFLSDKHHEVYPLEELTHHVYEELEAPLQHENEVIFEIGSSDLTDLKLSYYGYSERFPMEESITIQPRKIDSLESD
ncbi:DUF4179 domain-containing protein [Alkalicoccus daliensis]|uniref:DUF4179 domain-containing protein n=1 Tax=Alkalicoccus daliensis TaxID=745820 RepID=A0A1H0CK97_9BACI|nr:DUF4179 domain-containing protein [Alkalicoccus daliensis]SDN58265.1 hypothetical protein SAMN04488053_102133 [Alkalicoccus daliensis]